MGSLVQTWITPKTSKNHLLCLHQGLLIQTFCLSPNLTCSGKLICYLTNSFISKFIEIIICGDSKIGCIAQRLNVRTKQLNRLPSSIPFQTLMGPHIFKLFLFYLNFFFTHFFYQTLIFFPFGRSGPALSFFQSPIKPDLAEVCSPSIIWYYCSARMVFEKILLPFRAIYFAFLPRYLLLSSLSKFLLLIL